MSEWRSAWEYAGAVLGVHSDATPQVTPPSSDRERSTPPIQMRSGFSGSTARSLPQVPPSLGTVAPVLQKAVVVVPEALNMRKLNGLESTPEACVVHVPGSPDDVE